MERLARVYEKVKSRALRIASIAERTINAIIIDGNNMCYEGRTFIGLAARTLTHLRRHYRLRCIHPKMAAREH